MSKWKLMTFENLKRTDLGVLLRTMGTRSVGCLLQRPARRSLTDHASIAASPSQGAAGRTAVLEQVGSGKPLTFKGGAAQYTSQQIKD